MSKHRKIEKGRTNCNGMDGQSSAGRFHVVSKGADKVQGSLGAVDEELIRGASDQSSSSVKDAKRWRLERASFIVLTIYAALTAVQSCQSLKSTTATKEAADVARSSVQLTRDQFHLENRAYLSSGEAEEVLGGYAVVKIPITNTGHVPTKGSHLRLDYERMTAQGTIAEDRTYDYDTKAEIPPGSSAYFLTIGMPTTPSEDLHQLAQGKEFLLIRGRLLYDSGFGVLDTLFLCYDYGSIRKRWRNCSGQSMSIWLNDAQQRNPVSLTPTPATPW